MAITPRENMLKLFRREGFEYAPVDLQLCPSQVEEFKKRTGQEDGDYRNYYNMAFKSLSDLALPEREIDWSEFYDFEIVEGTRFTIYGVGHEPGGKAAMHMTRMLHPMEKLTKLSQFKEYPYPEYDKAGTGHLAAEAQAIKESGYPVIAPVGNTLWEPTWYMRGMENLMMDMMSDDEMATYHLDKMTEIQCIRAKAFAEAGADIMHTGDDIGMQKSIMMSLEMYRKWIKPRFTEIIKAAKDINPDIIVTYHSCGYVEPFIPDLIEAGVDVLNPVQPECMDFKELHDKYGDRLSFWGTLGTQTTLPFGTPEEVREVVLRNLEIAGDKGGLLCAPTHLVEPEVPWENIEAYIKACAEFSGSHSPAAV